MVKFPLRILSMLFDRATASHNRRPCQALQRENLTSALACEIFGLVVAVRLLVTCLVTKNRSPFHSFGDQMNWLGHHVYEFRFSTVPRISF
jgi:hypothetical protein